MGVKGIPRLPNPARPPAVRKPPRNDFRVPIAPVPNTDPDDPHGTAQCGCGAIVRLRALADTFGADGQQLYAFPAGWAFGSSPDGGVWYCSAACLARSPEKEN